MMNNTMFAFVLTFLAGFSTMIGTIIIFISKSNPKKIVLASLSFAAGVMITVSITDLIPESLSLLRDMLSGTKAMLLCFLGIILGVIISMLIDYYLPSNKLDGAKDKSLYKVGIISMLAIILHNIPEGIAIAMPIYFSTGSRYKAIKYSFWSGMTEPLGAFLSFLFLKPFINELILGIIFAVVCGIMIYISLAELIPSSRSYGHIKLSLLSIFLGIAIMPISHILL